MVSARSAPRYISRRWRNCPASSPTDTRFASGTVDTDEDGLSAPLVDPDKCVRIAGSSAILLTKQSRPEEVDRVVRVVADLLDGRWFEEPITPLKPEQIGILYRKAHPLIHTLREKLEKRRDCPVVWLTEKDHDARHGIAEPGVKILTMHGSKGLQFKAVS